jgi:hypothetical protein
VVHPAADCLAGALTGSSCSCHGLVRCPCSNPTFAAEPSALARAGTHTGFQGCVTDAEPTAAAAGTLCFVRSELSSQFAGEGHSSARTTDQKPTPVVSSETAKLGD